MARPLRIEYPGATYHVTSRGNERRRIFQNDADRRAFLEFLGVAAKRFGWSVTAWVLMTNHFHIVIQTPQPNLSRGMQWLNGKYAGWFNRRHGRCGHLFQGRFKAFLIDKESYFLKVLRYVVLNPVRAKMVERPEKYRWSSYRATAGIDSAPDWLDLPAVLGLFGTTDAQHEYRDFVLASLDSDERLWDNLTNGIYLGSEDWTKRMRAIVESKPRSTDHPAAQRAVGRPKMHAVVQAVADAVGTSAESLRSAGTTAIRGLAAWIGWNEGLLTLSSIAAGLRLRSEGYVSNLIRMCDRTLGQNPALLSQLDVAVAALRA